MEIDALTLAKIEKKVREELYKEMYAEWSKWWKSFFGWKRVITYKMYGRSTYIHSLIVIMLASFLIDAILDKSWISVVIFGSLIILNLVSLFITSCTMMYKEYKGIIDKKKDELSLKYVKIYQEKFNQEIKNASKMD